MVTEILVDDHHRNQLNEATKDYLRWTDTSHSLSNALMRNEEVFSKIVGHLKNALQKRKKIAYVIDGNWRVARICEAVNEYLRS